MRSFPDIVNNPLQHPNNQGSYFDDQEGSEVVDIIVIVVVITAVDESIVVVVVNIVVAVEDYSDYEFDSIASVRSSNKWINHQYFTVQSLSNCSFKNFDKCCSE
ncbi:MAG: hypothetical protein EZS28_006811 [Streblomastix strix]|uniref:Uncharacterized protein n=1 Tax=Streblomastix strix TaxID=222440 RepID=A0A5J4WT01_9EUKA|nr:MAG: hypothetical protein EZS28_006811 [Streblomastix strix]